MDYGDNNGIELTWDSKGNLLAEGRWRDGQPYEGTFWYGYLDVLMKCKDAESYDTYLREHGNLMIFKEGKAIYYGPYLKAPKDAGLPAPRTNP